MTICGALCAHTVVQYMEDPRSRNAVRVAFLWGRGKATAEELHEARIAAADAATAAWAATAIWAAARTADAYAATAARTAAAYAADAAAWAADNDAYAAWAAAADDAAYAAYAAAWAAAARATREANRLRTANIARKVLTEEVMERIQTIN